MGLSSLVNRAFYAGDGSSTVFAFSYEFFNPLDLQVYLFQTGSSLITPQVYGTNFSVTGAQNSAGIYPTGGNVAFTSAIPVGIQIVITRSPSPINIYSLLQNAPVNAPALVQQLDYLTALVQRCQDQIANCIQIPDGLGPNNGTYFSNVLPSGVNAPANGNAPLVLNSGATGWAIGSVVSFNSSGGSGFVGTIPVANGGTGQTGALTPNALIYAGTASAMGVTNVGSLNWPMLSNGGGSAPAFAQLPISGSNVGIIGVLAPSMGGTGNSSAVTTGAIVYGSAGVLVNLALGSPNQSLIAGTNGPTWTATPLQSAAVSGTLATLYGGTGLSVNPAFGVILYGSGSVFNSLLPGTNGQLLTYNGSSGFGWSSPFVNPMTAPGDTMYGGVGGAVTRLPAGLTNQVYIYSSSAQLPLWGFITNSSASGSADWSNANLRAMPAQTIKANSSAVAAVPQDLTISQLQNLAIPVTTYQRFTTAGSATYTLPTNPSPRQVIFKVQGGGGGGYGGGSSGGSSIAGSASVVGNFITAGGGLAAVSVSQGGGGGTNTITGSGVITINQPGGGGGAGGSQLTTFTEPSGEGGSAGFGGGSGLASFSGNAGGAGQGGGGGGGGGCNSATSGDSGGGGGGGGYVEYAVNSGNLVASLSIIVGAGGGSTAGSSGQAGGAGGTGWVLAEERY